MSIFKIVENCPKCGKEMLYFSKEDIYFCPSCDRMWERKVANE